MRLAGRLLVLLILLPSAAVADPMPRAGWIGLKAPNFYVIGDVGQRDLREVARRLEQFREAIGIMFPKAILSTLTPATVVVFKSHKSSNRSSRCTRGRSGRTSRAIFSRAAR